MWSLWFSYKTRYNYRYQIPEDWPYQEARHLFKEPNVTMDVPELKWIAPDEEVVMKIN